MEQQSYRVVSVQLANVTTRVIVKMFLLFVIVCLPVGSGCNSWYELYFLFGLVSTKFLIIAALIFAFKAWKATVKSDKLNIICYVWTQDKLQHKA